VAGCNDQYLRVYDIERKTVISATNAHDDDINAVSFADNSYRSDVVFSGGDDNLIKAWDRRMMTGQGEAGARPQGILIGHTEGITHITAKGDGRYLISNGKDQCCKLWDVRKMTSPSDLASKHPVRQLFNWDYRMMDYPTRDHHLHPYDDSVMTYRGHQVLETLIRCYFSPEETTGQRYIYTGSADGVVHVYDVLTGEIVSKMAHRNEAVRDVSWHPTEPTMCTVSWDGYITKWTYDESQPEGMPWWREGTPLEGFERECR
jgi:WD repeat-containing protein 23